ncbi:MAG: cupin domain-containing protein [Thermodesulfobacteriota bacterium]
MKQPLPRNILAEIPELLAEELIEKLLDAEHFFLERIVSAGQATAAGEWYDQGTNEWVILLSGSAGLLFEGEEEPVALKPGDYVLIPAGCRHRVAWTDSQEKTVWLALHYK